MNGTAARPMPQDLAAQARLPFVNILMATCNGARFLEPQLQSILAQSYPHWALWISDDASGDGTPDLVRAFQARHPERAITLVTGPGRGAAANFLHLVCHVAPDGGWVALSDQDDVWLPEKLARAVACLMRQDQSRPLAYGARTILADQDLRPYGQSPLHRRATGFHNAMVQNILGGNSTVLNGAAVAALRRCGVPDGVAYHDWWIYLFVTGIGGTVVIDAEPVLIYRQHGANVLGTNAGIGAWARRLSQVAGHEYRGWLRANCRALAGAAHLLTAENRAVLAGYTAATNRGGFAQALAIWRLGLRRQTGLGTLLILLAALTGRL